MIVSGRVLSEAQHRHLERLTVGPGPLAFVIGWDPVRHGPVVKVGEVVRTVARTGYPATPDPIGCVPVLPAGLRLYGHGDPEYS